MELTAALTGHFAAVTPLKPPSAGVTQTYLERVQAFSTLFWRLNESSGGTFAEGVSGTLNFSADAAAQAALEYADATLAQDDSGGRCLGFSTHGSSGATVLTRATNAAFNVTAGGWGCLVQVDDLTDKHILVAREEGAAADGNLSLEILAGGAVRSWRRTAGLLKDIQTLTGLITVGQAHFIWTDFGSEGLRIWIDDTLRAAESTPTTTWLTNTTSGIRVGRWVSGVSGLDGLLEWLEFRNTQPTAEQIATLASTQGVSLLNGATLPSVAVGQQSVIAIRDYGHFTATGVTVNEESADPPNIDVSASGEQVTITGVSEDAGETFDLSVTDGRGTTATRTFTIPVTAASSVDWEHVDGVDFDATGTPTQVTSILNAAIAAAAAGAKNPSTGRGEVHLIPGKTYQVTETGNGSPNNQTSALAILSNVEIRTAGATPPVRGGNQAIIQHASWGTTTGLHDRTLIRFDNKTNIKIGWLTLHGNKNSCSNVLTNIAYELESQDGGIHNIILYNGNTNITFKEVTCTHALVDGFLLAGTNTLGMLVEDCSFLRNRRQATTVAYCGSSIGGYDQCIFRRCRFADTGDFPGEPGQKPGYGVDVEADVLSHHVYGLTFDDCDFDNNQGSIYHWGDPDEDTQFGYGLVFDHKSVANNVKIINCSCTGNQSGGMYLMLRQRPTWNNWIVQNLVLTGNPDNTFGFYSTASPMGGRATNMLIENITTPQIFWNSGNFPSPWNTGWDVTINDPGQSVARNGVTNVTVNGESNP